MPSENGYAENSVYIVVTAYLRTIKIKKLCTTPCRSIFIRSTPRFTRRNRRRFARRRNRRRFARTRNTRRFASR
jgi:hypothetical protein